MDTTPIDRRPDAVTTYRRANGSQAATSRPRVQRPPRVYPLAQTPSPAARRAANVARRGVIPGAAGATNDTL
jgi:hypothetical protein